MPEYLSPGVYIEEIELGARPIEGVSTSTAGFLGETLHGPLEPRLVTGFEQFRRIYGGHMEADKSLLPFAVEGFFQNGGQRCVIARIASRTAVLTEADLGGWVHVSASGLGAWGNRIAVKVEEGSLQAAGQPLTKFKLAVMYWDKAPPANPPIDPTDVNQLTNPNRVEPDVLEVYDNLTTDKTSIDFFETVINANSNLIRVFQIPGANAAVLPLALIGQNGTDVAVDLQDYQGREITPPRPDDPIVKTGLKGFEQIDEIAIVVAPNHHSVPNLTTEVITHCTQMRDRFAILHSNPATDTINNIANLRPPQVTTYAAFYFPWIKVYNPLTKQDTRVCPSGHVAGIYAKTDIERGVFKAPANEVIVGAKSVEFQLTKRDQDTLNPRGVNCTRVFPGRGILLWGARTMSDNILWRYISVRRYFLYLGESIDEGTQWVVFEPNNERLWARVRQSITQFLTSEWRSGALMGLKPEEAFFVKCDRTTMTQDDIDKGRLICIIGVAVVKPAEFVIFRLAQFQGGTEITGI